MSNTTQDDIKRWLERGKEEGATHLIVVCDTFDYDDYPVFVSPKENVYDVEKEYQGNMQRVMEVYNLSMDWDEQLNENWSWS